MKKTLIKPNPSNPRLIKDDKFKKLVQSLKDFPEMATVRPVVIDENNVILGGNMRYKAMIAAGWDDIPVTQVTGWTEDQKREFIIKDNVSGGGWDWDVLANEWDMPQLEEWGIDLPKDLQLQPEVEEDEAPEVSQEPPVSQLGEVYQLGRHRLMCGDSTKIEDVEKLMNGQKADIAFTSPPYNVGTSGALSGNKHLGDNKYGSYRDDNPDYLNLLNQTTNNQLSLSKYVFINIQHLSGNRTELIDWLHTHRDTFADVMIWNKENAPPAMAEKVMNSAFEYIYVFSNKPTRAIGTRFFRGNVSNVYTAPPQRSNEFSEVHAATFPLHLPSYIVNTFSNPDEIILDLFGGSGSTLIACEQTNRTCFMCELDCKYIDVIIKRWMKFTGEQAYKIIDADGKQVNEPVLFADMSFMQSTK